MRGRKAGAGGLGWRASITSLGHHKPGIYKPGTYKPGATGAKLRQVEVLVKQGRPVAEPSRRDA